LLLHLVDQSQKAAGLPLAGGGLVASEAFQEQESGEKCQQAGRDRYCAAFFSQGEVHPPRVVS